LRRSTLFLPTHDPTRTKKRRKKDKKEEEKKKRFFFVFFISYTPGICKESYEYTHAYYEDDDE